jgi:hypothetical protein
MKKIIEKIKSSEELQQNLNYWKSRSDSDRLSAVQELREQYIVLYNKTDEYNESRKRLRRVYKAVKRK